MFKVLLAALILLYPLLIYVGLTHFSPGVMGLLVGALFVFRLGGLKIADKRLLIGLILLISIFAILVSITNSQTILKFYPVMVSLVMLGLFGTTLWFPPSMIERIARKRGTEVSEKGRYYVRNLTMIWCGFFLINGTIAAWTVTQPSNIWLLYNGLLSYLIMAALFVFELVYRKRYKRGHGVHP